MCDGNGEDFYKNKKIISKMTFIDIENRPFIAGNLFIQRYLKSLNMYQNFNNADLIHSNGGTIKIKINY
jgi:hypothetical protein